jgi:translation initiation factor 3 subunit E
MTATPATPKNTLQELLEWNLIDRISPYLDRHMIFPLLDYLEEQLAPVAGAQKEPVLQNLHEARYTLLRPTHMVDYRMDVYKSLHPAVAVPEELVQQKEQVLQDLEQLQKQCRPLLEEISSSERVGFSLSDPYFYLFDNCILRISCCISLSGRKRSKPPDTGMSRICPSTIPPSRRT